MAPYYVDPKCLLAGIADRLRKRHIIDRSAQHRAQGRGPLGAQSAIVFAYVVVSQAFRCGVRASEASKLG